LLEGELKLALFVDSHGIGLAVGNNSLEPGPAFRADVFANQIPIQSAVLLLEIAVVPLAETYDVSHVGE
jgi:hypothetical protein